MITVPRVTVTVAVAVAMLASVGILAQAPPRANVTPQAGTASIRGRVLAADGTVLRRAQVSLTGAALGEARTVATDEQGRYEITNLPSGSFMFRASKRGYLSLSYGQRRPGEAPRPFEVANGQALTAVDFHLPKGGVIVVRVTDEGGDPLSEIDVQAQQYRFSQGVRGLARVAAGGNTTAYTNDRGELRLYGLAPGDYYIAASFRLSGAVPADPRLSYAPTFYPGTANEAEAERVSIAVGEEKSINLRMSAVRMARISGVIRSSTGGPLRRISIGLDRFMPYMPARGTRVQPDGGFTFANVLPGDYFVDIFQGVTPEAAAAPDAPEYAMFPVTVAGGDDVTGLVVTAMRPGSAYGKVVFEGDVPAPRPGALPILANIPMRPPNTVATAPSNGRWKWNDDWTFEATNLMESRVFRLPAQAQGWFLKAVRLDGKDVTDVPLDFTHAREVRGIEIVLTRKQTEVSGTVVNASGQAVTEYAAVVYAEDPALRGPQARFIAAGQPNQQGRFTISGLPPGRYLAVAVEYLEAGSETDRDLLARLEGQATRLTLSEGESRALMLKIQ